MKRISMAAVAFVLFAYGAGAGAEESLSARIRQDAPKGITEAFYRCVDAASGNIEQAYCTSQERERQDHRLNTAYRALLDKLDQNQKQRLVEAERDWLRFRGSTIGFEDAMYGNEIASNLDLAQNELFFICHRANELERYLDMAGDL
jgi:uncharacterized protein YecT (DUF1311 family)